MPPKAMPSKGRFTPQWPSRPNPRTKRRDPFPRSRGCCWRSQPRRPPSADQLLERLDRRRSSARTGRGKRPGGRGQADKTRYGRRPRPQTRKPPSPENEPGDTPNTPERLDDACRRALDVDLIDVRRTHPGPGIAPGEAVDGGRGRTCTGANKRPWISPAKGRGEARDCTGQEGLKRWATRPRERVPEGPIRTERFRTGTGLSGLAARAQPIKITTTLWAYFGYDSSINQGGRGGESADLLIMCRGPATGIPPL